jgi:ribosomal protein L12E/L44/L45/RPP1/RPP2
MNSFKRKLLVATVAACLLVTCAPAGAGAFQEKSEKKKATKKEKETPAGTPVLWREPRDISTRNLLLGSGGARMRPDVRRLTFIKEEKGGFSTKYRVRDAAGRVWVAKVGKEAQSETASTRLLWAAGYMTEITYLVPRVNIPGRGVFQNVRFEARPANVEREGDWEWERNPFVGTRELQGLKVLMVLLNNWDTKDENNVLLAAPAPQGGGTELRYAISDLGATLGDTGKWPLLWRFTRSRNDPKGFRGDKLIDEIKDDGRVDFEFSGKKRGMFNDITVDEARWVGQLLSRLSDRQLADAFRAANYRPAEVRTLSRAVRARINELARLRRGASAAR